MKILYLCSKQYHEEKMDRNRFHSIAAIGNLSDLSYSGNGFDNYDDSKTVQENIEIIYGDSLPDLVVTYKPLEHRDFNKITVPSCLRYNEMWDRGWTNKEIQESGVKFIVAHHLNDIKNYKHLDDVHFANVSHCAEKTVYKDYGEEKTIDVMVSGAISRHYPFRGRLRNITKKLLSSKGLNCMIVKHPGSNLKKVRGPILEDYARLINRSKISLTCSSRYKYRLSKYSEIPMCGSLMAGDLPDEDQDFFSEFMLVLNPRESNEQIVDKIVDYVRDDDKRNELIRKGLEASKEYTQEKYAERFIDAANEYLEGKK
jgi:hypothetical protein